MKLMRLNYNTIGGNTLLLCLEEVVEADTLGGEVREVQKDDNGHKTKTKFFMEHIFLAVQIDYGGKGDDEAKEITKTRSKKEEKEREEEKEVKRKEEKKE